MPDYDAKFKRKLLEFFQHTSIVAIPNIFLTRFLAFKVIYLFFLIVAALATGWFINLSFTNYFAHEVKTKVTLEKSSSETTEFPTVTICNLQICGFKNYKYESQLDQYKASETEKLGTDQSAFVDERLRKNQTKTSFYSAQEIFLRLYNDSELEKNLNKINSSIKSMMLSCRYGDFGGDKSDCDETDFKVVPIGEFRKCYQFNSGNESDNQQIKKITGQQGRTGGLQLELYIGDEEDCQSPLTTTAGLLIYVNNFKYTLTEEDYAVQVPPGTQADIAVERTEIKKLAAPFSDCFNNETAVKDSIVTKTINLSPFHLYTQQYCLQICFEEFLIEFCDCYDNSVPFFGSFIERENNTNLKTCPKFIDSIYNCEYLIKKLFYNGKNDAQCLSRCPKECDSVSFKTTVSYSKYPSTGYMSLLSNDLTRANVLSEIEDFKLKQENLVAVNIFYKNQMYQKIEEQPAIEPGIFVVNFGGTLGLFLGCSILSFGELAEIIFEYIVYLVQKYLLNKRK